MTSIGSGVFSSCNKLTEITWSKNVSRISNSAFANCEGLTSITIPAYVTEIGESAFQSCTGVTGTLTIPDNVTVKTSKNRWRPYAKMFMIKGKMSRNALFIIDPVKLKVGDKTY